MIYMAGGNAYKLSHEHKNGWNAEAFKERYSEILERYDYIVGDWGYNQLRLRGFYREGHPKATKDTVITSLADYLNEYCNFGCAYFVLTKIEPGSIPPEWQEPAVNLDQDPPAGESSDAQTAETAAAASAFNGFLMRWPLKERQGGPVRMPGAAAVARAAAEAERRSQQQAQAGGSHGDGWPAPVRQGHENGYETKPQRRPSSGNAPDKRSFGQSGGGQADNRSSGKAGQAGRGNRPAAPDRNGNGLASRSGGQWRQPSDPARLADAGRGPEASGQRPDAAKNGGRWSGKNRRRNRFGGKPNRPDGAPREGGAPSKPGGE